MNRIERSILFALDKRPLDIHDLADTINKPPVDTLFHVNYLNRLGLIFWQYSDDELCITDAGRSALQERQP